MRGNERFKRGFVASISVLSALAIAACGGAGSGVRSVSQEANQSGSQATEAPQHITEGPTVCPDSEDECPSVRIVPTEENQVSDGAALVAADDWANNSTGKVGVTLARETVFPPFLWVANHTQNTVSRVNTKTGREEGRYWVAHNPSRTAVDLDGNVWIGGRNDGRLTKILWDVSKCPDRNEDGVVRTASAENLGPINSEADPYADECVVYSEIPLPEQRSIRGIAAGTDGKVWFGFTNGGVQSIDPETMELGPHYPPHNIPMFRRDSMGTYQPVMRDENEPATTNAGGVYGMVVDREGFLYTSSMSRSQLPRFNIFSKRWDAVFLDIGCQNYGIAIDGRDRVWLGCTSQGGIMMFDPSERRTHRFFVPQGTQFPQGSKTPAQTVGAIYEHPAPDRNQQIDSRFGVTGVAVEPATGDIWASFWSRGITGRLHLGGELSESTWTLIATAPGNDLRGVGFDYEGFAWTHGVSVDRIWKIDPENNQLIEGYEEGVPIGGGPHYTYSDFTGSTGLSFTAPRGVWRFAVDTPDDASSSPLRAIRWHAFVPANAQAEIRLRPVNDDGEPGAWIPELTGVGAAVYHPYPLGHAESVFDLSDFDLDAPQYEVEIRISTNGRERPVVNSVEFVWSND